MNNDKPIKLIVECDIGDEYEVKISELCSVKYSLPALGCYVVEVHEADYHKLEGIKGIKAVHKTAHITAQMDSARKAVNSQSQNIGGKMLTGKNIGIAVLDTGVAPVSDLCLPENRIIAFKDFIGNKAEPYDDNAHGTHVAR